MKTSELVGAELDYWVAKARGARFWRERRGEYNMCVYQSPEYREPWMKTRDKDINKERYTEIFTFEETLVGFFGEGIPRFSTDWAQGGLLIDQHDVGISTDYCGTRMATMNHGEIVMHTSELESYLMVVCRCVVASKFGEEVEE